MMIVAPLNKTIALKTFCWVSSLVDAFACCCFPDDISPDVNEFVLLLWTVSPCSTFVQKEMFEVEFRFRHRGFFSAEERISNRWWGPRDPSCTDSVVAGMVTLRFLVPYHLSLGHHSSTRTRHSRSLCSVWFWMNNTYTRWEPPVLALVDFLRDYFYVFFVSMLFSCMNGCCSLVRCSHLGLPKNAPVLLVVCYFIES